MLSFEANVCINITTVKTTRICCKISYLLPLWRDHFWMFNYKSLPTTGKIHWWISPSMWWGEHYSSIGSRSHTVS